MRRFLSFLFCLSISLFFLASCQSSQNPEQRLFRMNIGEDPPTLDPREVSDNISSCVIRMLFEGLMRYNPQGELEPAVAESVFKSEDGKTYTFKLRKTFWSNGDPVTAYDFERSWKDALSPKSTSAGAHNLFGIKNSRLVKEGKLPLEALGIQINAEDVLVVELERPDPYFLEQIATPYYYPVPSRYLDLNPKWNQSQNNDFVSNGPFVLEKWRYRDCLQVKKNPLYWEASSVKLHGILLTMVNEEATELKMFQAGELDWAGSPLSTLSLEAIPSLKKQGQLREAPARSVSMLILNTKKPPFHSVKMRKAFAYAINRDAIITYILKGGQMAALSISPSGNKETPSILFQDHDVKTAQQLFQEALGELGWEREKFPRLTLDYNTQEAFYKVALAIQDQWRKAFGITVELQNREWKFHLDKVHQGDFVIAAMGYIALTRDPLVILEKFDLDNTFSNPSGWSPEAFKQWIHQAKETSDKEQYLDFLGQAEAILISEMPVIPLFFKKNLYLKNSLLLDEFFEPSGQVNFRHAYFSDLRNTAL